ncbi:D11 protein [Pectobacterium phage DU_PP_V]|uniref:D11 protein n=1 Tax=Pectobacterium phage DU_PP_V TaxID=2041492 RepID=A0A2D2W788_9CAUD|nr:single strand DNA binding protein [Pectobacterium phage DU_PP_V]ATS94084.1 D11 protein [Pectobacterium phage DU_PP_V]
MAKSWGDTTGGSNDKVDFLKFNNGVTKVRVVSGVLPRYVYWIPNKDGKVAPFECLRFNRTKESFVRGKADPVHDMGFYEKELDKKTNEKVLLKPKKNYIAFVIDRSDNKLKVMEVKATILKGIQSTMKQLDLDNPYDIDIEIEKKGTGFDTEYEVRQISAMKFQTALTNPNSVESKRYEQDTTDILGEALTDDEGDFLKFEKVPSLDELYPVSSYEELKEAIESWIEGRSEESTGNASSSSKKIDSEAVSELD